MQSIREDTFVRDLSYQVKNNIVTTTFDRHGVRCIQRDVVNI